VIAVAAGCGSSGSSTEEVQPTTAAVTDSVPPATLAPPGSEPADTTRGSIVVQAPFGKSDAIYLLTPDGGLGDRLDDESQSSKHPDWSPDGTTVVYASDTDGALWTTTIGGAGPEQLITCDDGCLALDFPAFSPDGTLIAFTRYEPPTGGGPPAASSIRVLDLATMNTTEVVRTVQPELVDVARWSADGSQLVVGIDVFDEDFDETGSLIAVVDASGGDLKRLTDPDVFAYAPDWNPSTGEIVFSTETLQYRSAPQEGDDTWNLWVVSPDGSTPRRLTDVSAGERLFQPAWTPDGASILATMDSAAPSTRRIVAVDPTSGSITPISTTLATHARMAADDT
jgi:Tol biopolymer transport system component